MPGVERIYVCLDELLGAEGSGTFRAPVDTGKVPGVGPKVLPSVVRAYCIRLRKGNAVLSDGHEFERSGE